MLPIQANQPKPGFMAFSCCQDRTLPGEARLCFIFGSCSKGSWEFLAQLALVMAQIYIAHSFPPWAFQFAIAVSQTAESANHFIIYKRRSGRWKKPIIFIFTNVLSSVRIRINLKNGYGYSADNAYHQISSCRKKNPWPQDKNFKYWSNHYLNISTSITIPDPSQCNLHANYAETTQVARKPDYTLRSESKTICTWGGTRNVYE